MSVQLSPGGPSYEARSWTRQRSERQSNLPGEGLPESECSAIRQIVNAFEIVRTTELPRQ